MNDLEEFERATGSEGHYSPPARIPAATPGQATQVEQARAIAEVRAAVMIAMDRPRNRAEAIAEMREVCGIPALAERAFFRVPRGGEHVNGESIHLARELARCWGNVDYGVKELARDDVRGQSELIAFAWDLQTNARSEITFIVPHVKGKANRKLVGTQEIYENNASFAGRRLREAIFSVLPVWFKAEAADICHKTLETGGGKPLIQRIADTQEAFEKIGVSAAQLEKKRGRKIADFLAEDIGALRVVFGSIKRGEVTTEEEFPRETVVAAVEKPASKLDAIEGTVVADEEKPADAKGAQAFDDALDLAGDPLPPPKPRATARATTVHDFLDRTEAALIEADTAGIYAIIDSPDVQRALKTLTNGALDRLNAMLKAAMDRTADDGASAAEPPPDRVDEPA